MDIYFYYSEQKDKFSYLFCFFTLLFCNYAKSNGYCSQGRSLKYHRISYTFILGLVSGPFSLPN